MATCKDSDGSDNDCPSVTYPSGRLAAITRKSNEIKRLMDGEKTAENKANACQLMTELKTKINCFQEHCSRQTARDDVSSSDLTDFIEWRDKHLTNANKFLVVAEMWMSDLDVDPSDSVSQTKSNTSSLSKLSKIREEALEAELRTKLEAEKLVLEEKALEAKVEYEKRQLKIRKEKLELEGKYMEEKFKRLESISGHSDNSRSAVFKAKEERGSLSSKILQWQATAHLPRNEPDLFDGKLIEYKSFRLAFDRIIVEACQNDKDKYYYLLRYTKGYPNDLVKSCLSEDFHKSFSHAISLLDKYYDNDVSLAQTYLDKIEKWPPIKAEDSLALDELSMYLTSCLNLMPGVSYLNQLNSWKELKTIIMKLPFDMRKRFRSKVASLQRESVPVTFETVVNFVNREAECLKIPLFGSIKETDQRVTAKSSVKQKQATFNTFEEIDSEPQPERERETRAKCHCCGKANHELNDCKFFLAKSMPDREKFVKRKNICFGCLKHSNHRSKDCRVRLRCSICRGPHPSAFHKTQTHQRWQQEQGNNADNFRPERAQALRASNRSINRVLCPCIPVKIKIKGSNDFITTNMALDTYSTACYLDEALLSELKMTGKESSITLTTMENSASAVPVKIVEDLEVHNIEGDTSITIPKLFAKAQWPFELEDTPTESDIDGFPILQQLPIKFVPKKIGLLIGINMPDIVKPLDIVQTTPNGPYATRHSLGWAANGPVGGTTSSKSLCFQTAVREQELESKIEGYFKRDFVDLHDEPADSVLDIKWRKIVTNGIKKLPSGAYEIPLPFKDPNAKIPNNFGHAMVRLRALRRQLESDELLHQEYSSFMDDVLKRGFAEEVPENSLQCPEGKVWYLPHHGVRHRRKKKLRVVYDCSAKFKDISLNDLLLQGHDFTSNLTGVLLRFREGTVAVSADIAKMYYMVKVPEADADYLRFLWYKENNLASVPKQYRLRVHVFGAKSSPSVANFALQHCLENGGRGEIVRNFYVDDFLYSSSSEKKVIELVAEVREILSKCSFDLTQFSSCSRSVLASLPNDKLSKDVVVSGDKELPEESALGVVWDPETDSLCYKICPKDSPFTKRGVLSCIFSVYDPFNIVCPILIRAKNIFQNACLLKLGWDEKLPETLLAEWKLWLQSLEGLTCIPIRRCFSTLGEFADVQLHLFSDGSELAYGSVAYLRFVSGPEVQCCITMAMVRLVPLKKGSLKTIPRIELNAAKLSVSLFLKLKRELCLKLSRVFFWSDSSIVLSYIKSENGRFQRFVANRVSFIRSHTDVNQWHHVPGKQNPADILSRGSKNGESFLQSGIWFNGPEFLSKSEEDWPEQVSVPPIEQEDLEVKSMLTVCNKTEALNPTEKLLASSSSYYKLKRKVAVLLRVRVLASSDPMVSGSVSVSEMAKAETEIFCFLQRKYYGKIRALVSASLPLPRKHVLTKVCPFLDSDGVLRVRGRLKFSDIPYQSRCPVVLPGEDHVVKLIVEECHKALGHLGRETLLAHLRTKYFVVGGSTLVKAVLRNCIVCRKVQGKPSQQIMADLPKDRVTSHNPPFSSTGIDYFGPFMVSRGRGRAKEKRYGLICSCLATRSCHLEVANSLDTDSFICAIRRFIARRGPVHRLRSDNGTNFVGGRTEISKAIAGWNDSLIDDFCKQKNIEWIFNPPRSSHYGGIYEREIRTARKVLNSLLLEFDNQIMLTDEMLSTLMCEVENILNSRPLTSCSADVDDLEALTPNHLLRLNTEVSFPPGLFDHKDLYSRRRWRQVQYLADLFWSRWRKEYLPSLQQRQIWFSSNRTHKIGDLVLVVDENLPRNLWCLGRVVDLAINERGHLRSAKIKVSRCKDGKNLKFGSAVIERSINKLILLAPAG